MNANAMQALRALKFTPPVENADLEEVFRFAKTNGARSVDVYCHDRIHVHLTVDGVELHYEAT